MTLPGTRPTFLILFLGAMGLIATGLYFQYVLKLIPCSLCITQRIFIIAGGLVALVAFFHNPQHWGRKIYGLLGIVLALIGAGVASRQLWLQSLPADQVPACGPDITYMFANFPLREALELLFRGDGNCAEVSWTFLGVSIPGWTLVAFIGVALINAWQCLRAPTRAQDWTH